MWLLFDFESTNGWAPFFPIHLFLTNCMLYSGFVIRVWRLQVLLFNFSASRQPTPAFLEAVARNLIVSLLTKISSAIFDYFHLLARLTRLIASTKGFLSRLTFAHWKISTLKSDFGLFLVHHPFQLKIDSVASLLRLNPCALRSDHLAIRLFRFFLCLPRKDSQFPIQYLVYTFPRWTTITFLSCRCLKLLMLPAHSSQWAFRSQLNSPRCFFLRSGSSTISLIFLSISLCFTPLYATANLTLLQPRLIRLVNLDAHSFH